MADYLDDAREGWTCLCGHLGKRHLGVRGQPLHACLDCSTCGRFSPVADAEGLDPAVTEQIAAALAASDYPDAPTPVHVADYRRALAVHAALAAAGLLVTPEHDAEVSRG